MGLFGRESKADTARADAFKAWISARSGHALVSTAMGVVAILDAFTLILGVLAGIAAIILGFKGLETLERKPELMGKRFCYAGMALGGLGICFSLLMWLVIYPWLSQMRAA